jgi:hypothetical protein
MKETFDMTKRLLAVGAVALGMLAMVQAQNSVTYILMNGDRVSGATASSSEASPSMPRGELNLERANGEELSFGLEQVAVIDYAGGTPSAKEVEALPGDNDGQMVMFRDGNFWHGQFEDLRPRELRWRTNGRQEIAQVDRILRIYLNAGRAREIFGNRPGATAPGGQTAGGTSGGWRGTEAGPIAVAGNQAWTDSGLNVRRGDRLRFSVTGQVRVNGRQASTSAGLPGARPRGLPLPDQPFGMLIAKIGNEKAFPVGDANAAITMTANGRLWFGINDNAVGDNSGEFIVNVRRGQ